MRDGAKGGLFGGKGAIRFNSGLPVLPSDTGGIVLEGVWAMVRSGKGPLFAKFIGLAERMNRRKSAVAVARKMVTLAWLLMKRKEYYCGISNKTLEKKLRYYKLMLRRVDKNS
jgi:hypothetical protein